VSPRFELRLDRERYAPGDAIRGTIRVLDGGRSRSVEARLQYNEKTEDYAVAAISVSSGPLQTGDVAPGASFAFELALPADALPNYRGEHGELYWEIDVKSEELGPDSHERRRIDVAPVSPEGGALRR
jgi:hypothetical protein